MKDIDALFDDARTYIRRGRLFDAYRCVLEICTQARVVARLPLEAVALQLQSGLTLLNRSLDDAGFEVARVGGAELAGAMSNSAGRDAIVDAFETRVHALFDETHDRAPGNPSAERIKAYLDANFRRKLTIEQVAPILRCSVSHIYKVFKPTVGTTPADYLLDLRLGASEQELVSRPLRSVEGVAEDCGFGSVDAFHRNFREKHGMSPSEYRRRDRASK